MNFVRVEEGSAPEEISQSQAMRYLAENNNVSRRRLSDMPPEALQKVLGELAELGVYPLTTANDPTYDPDTEKLGTYHVEQINGAWIKSRPVVALSSEERAQLADRKLRSYQKDLIRTAGLALIEWQAGDATQQDFLDAVAAVKALHGRT